MIGTFFRIRKYIKDTQQGINEPSNFAFEQLVEAALIPLIIPGLIIMGLLILLGIFGFSHLVSDTMRNIIQIFFWIILICAVISALGLYLIYRGLKKLWNKIATKMGIAHKKIFDIS